MTAERRAAEAARIRGTEVEYVDELTNAQAERTERCCKQVGLLGLADDFRDDVRKGAGVDKPPADSGATYDIEAATRSSLHYWRRLG